MIRNREAAVLALVYSLSGLLAVGSCFAVNLTAGFICAAGILLTGTAFFVFTRRRYRDIAALSDYIRTMADGELVYDIRDNTEGELSILKSDVYKLVMRLSEQTDLLRDEKIMLKDVLFDISHQLKTPITSLTVMTDLLEQEELPPEKRREFVGNLQTGLSRMDWLVKSLLKLARLDAGADPLKTETVNVHELAELAIDHIKTIIEVKKQFLTLEIDESLSISCDANWTTEALVNILKNASEHTPEGGSLILNAGENPICTWICVRDNGNGIGSADLPHLFKRFHKGRHSAKDSIGIGLAMSLSVMQKQNGDIEVQTEKGKGSAFTMKFYK